MHRWRVDVRFAPMDSWSCLVPATFQEKLACKAQGRSCQHRAGRDGDRSRRCHPDTDALGVHCLTLMEYIEAQGGRSERVRLRGIAHPFGSVPRTCQDRREQGGQGDTGGTCRLR